METISQILARELDRPQSHIDNVIQLLDEGNTIPFIARYRKEMHGAMDDTALRTLADRLEYLRNLQERRDTVKKSIEEQGKMSDELSAAIDEAQTLAALEDLYRPYKPKRRTRATIAKEKGLEPLADLLFAQSLDCPAPELAAADYVDEAKGLESVEAALAGASDIIAERISDDAAIRQTLRELIERSANLVSLAATEDTIIQIGKGGIGDAAVKSIVDALEARELVKISVLDNSDETARSAAEELAERTGSDVVAVIGRKIILFKESSKPEKRKISQMI